MPKGNLLGLFPYLTGVALEININLIIKKNRRYRGQDSHWFARDATRGISCSGGPAMSIHYKESLLISVDTMQCLISPVEALQEKWTLAGRFLHWLQLKVPLIGLLGTLLTKKGVLQRGQLLGTYISRYSSNELDSAQSPPRNKCHLRNRFPINKCKAVNDCNSPIKKGTRNDEKELSP